MGHQEEKKEKKRNQREKKKSIRHVAATGSDTCWWSIHGTFDAFLCPVTALVLGCRDALRISLAVGFFFPHAQIVRISVSLINTTQGRGIHRNSPLWGWSCSHMCRCIMGQQQADSRLCSTLLSLSLSFSLSLSPPLSLCCVGYKSVILIDQSKPPIARREEKRRGYVSYIQWDGSSSSSMIPRDGLSQSVRGVHSFWDPQLGFQILEWAYVCNAFNPSVIRFLLLSHECRDFQHQACGRMMLLAASLITSALAAAAAVGEEKKKRGNGVKRHAEGESYTATEQRR